jgi:hypothetical protein
MAAVKFVGSVYIESIWLIFIELFKSVPSSIVLLFMGDTISALLHVNDHF